jgi:SAM-dependent MidA family methyltransferase
MDSVDSTLRARILREGPLRFSDVVDAALYGPGGFYTVGRGAGHRRDFVTSPEVGALFGSVVATALDGWWAELGRPDPFLVAECGAGPGTLAVTLLAAGPECAPALRLVLVDVSPIHRDAHRKRGLPMVEPHELLGAFIDAPERGGMGDSNDDETDDRSPYHGQPAVGPLCTTVANLPECEFHVVLANELLDNLAFDVLQRSGAGWSEVRVGIGPVESGLAEMLVPAAADRAATAGRLVPDADLGDRVPLLVAAHEWLADALRHLAPRGRVVCIDYGAPTAHLARRDGHWLRTYRDHQRGYDPLLAPGSFDITIDVPFDQLAPQPDTLRTQADFLNAHGMADRVAAAERVWLAEADTGGLRALRARSIPHEASVLSDPNGLGAFTVAEWIRR